MKLTLEENQLLSDKILSPILKIIDKEIWRFDVERLKETLEEMKGHQRTVQAFPFPETLDRSESLSAMNNLFEKIVELIELRQKQKDIVIEQQKESQGMQVLKQLGF